MSEYSTGDYFLDHYQSLCVITSIASVYTDFTIVCIKNIQTSTDYRYALDNNITKEKHIGTWLGQIDGKAAQILYIKEHDAKKYVSFNNSDDVILEWKPSRKNS